MSFYKKLYRLALSKYIINPNNIDFVYEMFSYISAKYFKNYINEILFNRFNKYNLDVNNLNFPEHITKNYKSFKLYLLTDTDFTFSKSYKITKIKSLNKIPEQKFKKSIFFLLFQNDDDAAYYVNEISKRKGKFYPLHYDWKKLKFELTESTRYLNTNSKCAKAISYTWDKINKLKLVGNFDSSRLGSHENLCEAIELTKNIKGDILEIGVGKGASGLTILNYLNICKIKKKTYFFDTFIGFNYKEALESSDIIWSKSHKLFTKKIWINKVNRMFSSVSKNYEIKELNIISDKIPSKIKKISLCHIDIDQFEATSLALKKVDKLLLKGGIIMCEDAVYTPKLYGAYTAYRNFTKSSIGKKYIPIFKKNHFFLIKK